MTKNSIIDEVAAEAGISKKTAKQIVNSFLAKVHTNVVAGHSVKLMGFGTFLRRIRKKKIGSDPVTHQRVTFRSKGWPKFIPSRQLKRDCE